MCQQLAGKRDKPRDGHESENGERENGDDDEELSDDWRDKFGEAGSSKESANSRSSRG